MTTANVPSSGIAGAVIVGRNEGERFLRCLSSVRAGLDAANGGGGGGRIVYVDSGSTDGSVEAARAAGAEVVELDLTRPFTAARARNAGLAVLTGGEAPDYVQFVDGDCELDPNWIITAKDFLERHPDAAVACGRRQERFPEASIYNALCNREWDTPIGEARACGGDALMRRAPVVSVGGYNPALIAGEEPEMCVRLRAEGWKIHRLDAEMTLHDAAMTRFGQFWKRARRAGHAFAEGAAMHGRPPERHFVSETRRAILWGAVLPAVILAAAVFISPAMLLLTLIYPAQVVRLGLRDRERSRKVAFTQAGLLTVSKFAEAVGAAEFYWRRLRGRPAGLIEYK
ncbi:glycosyltransferase family A protein [Falsirhodobacter deserti]|uniref:glycosyltransferase family A protein n=1 Tax=Falsirhodobacter deserti TaxID=1365611 RepID=UPI000FE42CD3|nr:glycosyltransferase family A protein [Falsirhodobacter deserti]